MYPIFIHQVTSIYILTPGFHQKIWHLFKLIQEILRNLISIIMFEHKELVGMQSSNVWGKEPHPWWSKIAPACASLKNKRNRLVLNFLKIWTIYSFITFMDSLPPPKFACVEHMFNIWNVYLNVLWSTQWTYGLLCLTLILYWLYTRSLR